MVDTDDCDDSNNNGNGDNNNSSSNTNANITNSNTYGNSSSDCEGGLNEIYDGEDDVFRSFEELPTFGAQLDSPTTATAPLRFFEHPRFQLDVERSLSPHPQSKFREQLAQFSHGSGQVTQRAESADDLVRLWWACERTLPYCVYQVLFFSSPERRRRLANSASTAESYCGPLHAACRQGHLLLVKMLLAFGADPNLPSSEGLSPLHYAVEGGNLEVLSALLATAKGDPAKIALMLEKAPSSRCTPLAIAAQKGFLPLAKELLTRAENLPPAVGRRLKRQMLKSVSSLDSQGLRGTPLEIATLYGHREMVLFLLNHGADPIITEVDYTLSDPPRLTFVHLECAAR